MTDVTGWPIMSCNCSAAQIAQLSAGNLRLRCQVQSLERQLQRIPPGASIPNAVFRRETSPTVEQVQPSSMRTNFAKGTAVISPFHDHGGSFETLPNITPASQPAFYLPCWPEPMQGGQQGASPEYDPLQFASELDTSSATLHRSLSEATQTSEDDDQRLAEYDDLLVLNTEFNDDLPEPDMPALAPPTELPIPLHLTAGCAGKPTQGVLDGYIMALGSILKNAVNQLAINVTLCSKLSAHGVLWAVQEAWPQAEHYWKVTASLQGFFEVEMWRNFPCAQTFGALHPAYRPTRLQLCTPHPPIIDWLPWPDLRDKLIEQQHQFPDVDMVCRTAIHNVVAHRRTPAARTPAADSDTTAIAGTSFRVWDLCTLEEQAGFSSRPASNPSTTTTTSQSPFTQPSLVYKPRSAPVTALARAYQLEYDELSTQKLHGVFFDTYPSLYCESIVSRYQVRHLPAVAIQHEPVLGRPKALGPGAMARLRAVLEEELLLASP